MCLWLSTGYTWVVTSCSQITWWPQTYQGVGGPNDACLSHQIKRAWRWRFKKYQLNCKHRPGYFPNLVWNLHYTISRNNIQAFLARQSNIPYPETLPWFTAVALPIPSKKGKQEKEWGDVCSPQMGKGQPEFWVPFATVHPYQSTLLQGQYDIGECTPKPF